MYSSKVKEKLKQEKNIGNPPGSGKGGRGWIRVGESKGGGMGAK
jgi:hypothetical protein